MLQVVLPSPGRSSEVRGMRVPLSRRTFAALIVLFASPVAALADEPVDFERHIMGLFGRSGCNAGGCHGSFQGKGGFRLSLFGYEPEKDYYALTRDSQGRR